MKVLLIGNGAREHALADHLVRSGAELYSYMKHLNPGIAALAKDYKIGRWRNLDNLLELSSKHELDYAIIGPDKPLFLGMVDYLQTLGIGVIGPTKAAAQLETSKIFARHLLARHSPRANPKYFVCNSIQDLEEALPQLGRAVIKPDGWTGGIGVKIEGTHLQTRDDFIAYGKELLREDTEDWSRRKSFIVEEFMHGTEFSLQAFCDGSKVEPMPLVQDYRSHLIRHSLGSVSAPDHGLPGISPRDIEEARTIVRNMFKAMYAELGVMYQGILYGQFIKTDEGVKVVEFNSRFGDPEALNVLHLLRDNLDEFFYKMTQNKMEAPSWRNDATMALYLVPKGFIEGSPVANSTIEIPTNLPSDVNYYYGAVYQEEPFGRIQTIHKRSLSLFTHGSSIEEVRHKLHSAASTVKGELTWSDAIGKDM